MPTSRNDGIEEPLELVQRTRRDEILGRLAEIDRMTDKARTWREVLLGVPGTLDWLKGLDDEAAELRAELNGGAG